MKNRTNEQISKDSFDVMPILPSFVDIDYDPYSACHNVQLLLSAKLSASDASKGPHSHTLDEIVRVLIESIVKDQREKMKFLTKSFRYNCSVYWCVLIWI